MKTLRLAIISLVAVASASATFAGPGPQYWAARRAEQETKKVAPFVPTTTEKSGSSCDTMIVKQGKRTSTVPCTGAITETAKCKAACGS